jgi:serine/threonine protein kinase
VITAVIDGHAYPINDQDSSLLVGTGGEADVYRFTPNAEFIRRHGNRRYVLKLFRKATTEVLRRAARERQMKLVEFPSGLPGNVITPLVLAFDCNDQVIGYVMAFVPDGTPLIKYGSAKFRRDHLISVERILRIMANLHDLVNAVHAHGIVIGDFNDKNVLVLPNDEVCLLDADSFQFGRWECPTFVPGFVDPQIIGPGKVANTIIKTDKHSALTDWYAYAVMLFQLLVGVNPYTGGFYNPPQEEAPIKGAKRIHNRISVFHPRVTLPNSAVPFDRLPPGILDCFRLIFEQEQRGVIPRELLTRAQPTQPKPTVPQPAATPPQPPPPRATPVQPRPRTHSPFTAILGVSLQGGQPRYVYHDRGAYRREGGRVVLALPNHDARLSPFPAGDRTVVASSTEKSFAIFTDDRRSTGAVKTQVQFGRVTVAANDRHVYWLRGSELVRDGYGGTVVIGNIAPNLTSVWVGERFGIALEQAGVLTRILTFGAERSGLHSITLPPDFGSVIDAQCVVGDKLAWLTLSIENGGRVVNRCYVFDALAQLHATAEANQGDGSWLGSMTPAAHATVAKLITPVPQVGIVRVGIAGQRAKQEIVYPNSSALVPDKDATVGLTYNAQGVLHYSKTSIDPIATTL